MCINYSRCSTYLKEALHASRILLTIYVHRCIRQFMLRRSMDKQDSCIISLQSMEQILMHLIMMGGVLCIGEIGLVLYFGYRRVSKETSFSFLHSLLEKL